MYIHQLEDWPNLTYDLNEIGDLLAEVRYEQGLLLGRVADWGFTPRLEAEAATMVIEVIANSAIEGERLPAKEVRSSVAQRLNLAAAGLPDPSYRISGVVEMMLDANQRFDQPLTEVRLFGWHAALFPAGYSGMIPIRVGKYRDHPDGEPMRVVSGRLGREKIHYEAPSASLLPEGMKRLLRYVNAPSEEDPLLVAGKAHLWFLTLHPFDDGNGRIARALTDWLLARGDRSGQRFYSLSSAILTTQKYYYRELEAAQKGTLDVTRWLRYFLTVVQSAIRSADEHFGEVLTKAKFWRQHQATALNDRQRLILNKLWDGYRGKLTSFRYANLTDVSRDTATRDINDLVKKGILRRGAAGGRSTAYELVRE